MDGISEHGTLMHSTVQAQTTPQQTKIYTINPCQLQPINILKCGFENVPQANNSQEILSLLKTIIDKQEAMEKRMEEIEKSVFNTEILISKNIIERATIMAQKQVSSTERTAEQIEEDTINEIAARFPLVTMDALLEVEQKLNVKEYYNLMVGYIKRFKDSSGSVDKALRQMFADNLVKHFNLDGRCGKEALSSLKLVEILYELFQIEGRKSFERNVRKYVELSHNRVKQRNSLENKTKRQHESLENS